MADWQSIKTEYITTDTSYRKLAEKYGISRVQVANVGKDEGWVELRRQYLAETLSKTLDAMSDAEAARAARILKLTDKILDRIEALVEDAKPAELRGQTLRNLTAAVKDIMDIQGIQSRRDAEEQDARIANLRRQAQKEQDTADTIEVIFAAGPEEWNE